ncbi:MAG: carbohydrate ABC transporter permease, partial [Candidatus Devosia euplotis]|nr:carbohydrate ABC transporter permease [Candidatus Devosia euplotis]
MPARIGLYAFLVAAALFFLMPVYVMLMTSFKSMEEIRPAQIFALPDMFDWSAWIAAWSSACAGVNCTGVSVGF